MGHVSIALRTCLGKSQWVFCTAYVSPYVTVGLLHHVRVSVSHSTFSGTSLYSPRPVWMMTFCDVNRPVVGTATSGRFEPLTLFTHPAVWPTLLLLYLFFSPFCCGCGRGGGGGETYRPVQRVYLCCVLVRPA